MMTSKEVMAELKSMGSESIKKIYLKHGFKEPFFGVKVEQLKTLEKKIKQNYPLAKELYATGNADAMYLAGLITDDEKMSKPDLQRWVKEATSQNISEYAVPWVASGSALGFELALDWIESKTEHIAAAGWSTLGHIVSRREDSELDLTILKSLIERVSRSIHSVSAPDRVRYTMNNFIIAIGSYVVPLATTALEAAKKIGPVTVNKNGTACQVPAAQEHILKARLKGAPGKKKKKVKC